MVHKSLKVRFTIEKFFNLIKRKKERTGIISNPILFRYENYFTYVHRCARWPPSKITSRFEYGLNIVSATCSNWFGPKAHVTCGACRQPSGERTSAPISRCTCRNNGANSAQIESTPLETARSVRFDPIERDFNFENAISTRAPSFSLLAQY